MRPVLHYDPYKGYQTKRLRSLKTIELFSVGIYVKLKKPLKKINYQNFLRKQKVKKQLNTLENVINNKVIYT